MWNASCFKNAKEHVEILEIMRTSTHKDFIEIDKESVLPKYKLRDILPKSKISVYFYVVEDENNKERKIKTLLTDWEEKFPNNN